MKNRRIQRGCDLTYPCDANCPLNVADAHPSSASFSDNQCWHGAGNRQATPQHLPTSPHQTSGHTKGGKSHAR
jgi:hypothetical protein